jgi:hypothetical protein
LFNITPIGPTFQKVVQFNATSQSTKSKPVFVSRSQKDLATISMGINQYETHGNATKIVIGPNI